MLLTVKTYTVLMKQLQQDTAVKIGFIAAATCILAGKILAHKTSTTCGPPPLTETFYAIGSLFFGLSCAWFVGRRVYEGARPNSIKLMSGVLTGFLVGSVTGGYVWFVLAFHFCF